MTNEEKRWVNDELGKVEDIPEEQVEQMVDEIPQESEDETSSDDPFEELARQVRDYVDILKDLLSDLGVEFSIVFGLGLGKDRVTIIKGSPNLCKKLLPAMTVDFMKALKKRQSERGEHEG